MYFAPPTAPQGNTCTKTLPAFHALITSVGVRAPAIINLPSRFTICTVSRSNPGLTINSAPASIHRWTVSESSTVPAPIRTSEPRLFASWEIASTAPGTVIVISTIGMPPAQTASAALMASCAEDVQSRSRCFSKRGCDYFEWHFSEHLSEHVFKRLDFYFRDMLVDSLHVISKCGRKILLVPEHHIHQRSDAAVDFLCAFLAA